MQLVAKMHVAHDVAAAQHADQHPVSHHGKLIHPIGDHQLERGLQVGIRRKCLERHVRHDLAYGCCRPRVVCDVLGVGDAHQAHQSSTVDHRQRSVAVTQRVLEHEVLHAQPGCGDRGRGLHDGCDRHPAQHGGLLLARRLGASVEEPANEGSPQPAENIAAKQARNAPPDQHKGNGLPDIRGDSRGPRHIARGAPQDRP